MKINKLTLIGIILLFSISFAFATPQNDNVIFSEIHVNAEGSDQGKEFIELYNPTDSAINIGNWKIKFSSEADRTIPIGFSINAHGFFLIASNSSGVPEDAWPVEWPEPDLRVPFVSLANIQAGLQLVGDSNNIIDRVGWGNSSNFPEFVEGTALESQSANAGNSLERKPGYLSPNCGNWQDTNNNSNDFLDNSNPEPQNSANALETPCNATPDTTPPSSITNLHVTNVTNESIKWVWNNPTDTDFFENIIYIDGINELNATTEIAVVYNLIPGTEYTITVHTKDISGNVNDTDVSDTERTLSNLPVECTVDEDCNDNKFCNGVEVCVDSVCQTGTPPDVDDSNLCTNDVCNETADEVVHIPVPVNDGVSCTVDSCDIQTGEISHAPDNSLCDTGFYCDAQEGCVSIDPVCGNSIIEEDEECDDGNNENDDECANDCTLTYCGDGIEQYPNGQRIGGPLNDGYEECDEGDPDVYGQCFPNCTLTYCGDGYVQNPNGKGEGGPNNNGYEECDDGNNLDNDGCSALCKNEFCGDGIINCDEECDGSDLAGKDCTDYGYANSDTLSCLSDCSGFGISSCEAVCGNNVVEPIEECDDNNLIDGDGCSSTCEREIVDDLQINYLRGKMLIDGVIALPGTKYKVAILSGDNVGDIYEGEVDDENIPPFLRGNGFFDTNDQIIFSTGSSFRITSGNCSGSYEGQFLNGGNGNFIDENTLINFSCVLPPVITNVYHSPSEPTEIEEVTIFADVTDNIKVDRVFVNYTINSSIVNLIEMSLNNLYSVNLGIFGLGSIIEYMIVANDTYGNYNVSDSYIITIAQSDLDGDGIRDAEDNCPLNANADQANHDDDNIGDVCDEDDDNDGISDEEDNCPLNANADQANYDDDHMGDVCDEDDDNDGVLDEEDGYSLDPNRWFFGDINSDNNVNILDLIVARNAIGTKPGDPNWNDYVDVNNDGVINILDLIIIRNNFT